MTTVDEVWDDFTAAVNMTPTQLERWLESDQSQAVGQKDGGGESTGHESGRRIVQILRTKRGELTEDDAAHMKKVRATSRGTPRSARTRARTSSRTPSGQRR